MKRTRRHILQRVTEMTQADWDAWAAMRAANPSLISPYFHSDYTRLLSDLRPDVRIVSVYNEAGEPIAFLPIQGQRFARPVGAPMSDYHGLITPDPNLTYKQALAGTGIGALHFSHAVDPAKLGPTQILSREETAALEIKTTAEDWRATKDGSYRRHLKSNRRRVRKATEEIGEPRVELFSRNIDVYQTLLDWKRAKFSQTGKYDVLSADWTQSLIRDLWERGRNAALRCDMHALYFGDRLAAIDLGLSDGHTFHSWMVAYDDALSEYGPGIQLMEGLIEATPETGYGRIDLGAGLEGYKRHYATQSKTVIAGFVPIEGAAGRLSRVYAATERWGETALRDAPGKLRRRYSQIAACEDGVAGRTRHMLAAFKLAIRH
ncbi:GNAT family N-acetyltransferase [Litorimonas sp. WD9-15]|uniref:GNAT family N-acetyltransferase n=1 Tax=Litorimonas sp. WD9-15 TaxID=3418716 RepID=UPI003D06554A